MTCDECGVELAIGMFPFCHGDPTKHAMQAAGVSGDELVGGFVQEHFGPTPEVFYSKREMAKRAAQLGLQPFVRHVDGDKHVSRWV